MRLKNVEERNNSDEFFHKSLISLKLLLTVAHTNFVFHTAHFKDFFVCQMRQIIYNSLFTPPLPHPKITLFRPIEVYF